jgi:hypothetical protein
MIEIARAPIWALASRFKTRARLEVENLVLRQQLAVLRRAALKRVRLRLADRFLFVWLYRFWPRMLNAMAIVRPESVLRWHRRGFAAYWRWKSRRRPGRPRVPEDIRRLIREISGANPFWGAPRIQGELSKLGTNLARSTVAKYMAKGRHPPSQSRKTFLRNHADGLASADFFVVPTIGFKLLFGFIVLGHGRRRLAHVG